MRGRGRIVATMVVMWLWMGEGAPTVPVEAECVRVVPEKPLHVRRRRQDVELLVLERLQVLRANLRLLLELKEVEVLAHARLAQAGADLEHERRF